MQYIIRLTIKPSYMMYCNVLCSIYIYVYIYIYLCIYMQYIILISCITTDQIIMRDVKNIYIYNSSNYLEPYLPYL